MYTLPMQTCNNVIPSWSIRATEGHPPTMHSEASLGLEGRHPWFDSTMPKVSYK